jgi:hypothetical protein
MRDLRRRPYYGRGGSAPARLQRSPANGPLVTIRDDDHVIRVDASADEILTHDASSLFGECPVELSPPSLVGVAFDEGVRVVICP